MHNLVFIGILLLYHAVLFIFGQKLLRVWFNALPFGLHAFGSLLVGLSIGVPLTYVFSCFLSGTNEPMLWGVVTSIGVLSVTSWLIKQEKNQILKITPSEVGIIVGSIGFSYWLMTKTFHGGATGELFVGSNNVFDFGFALGLVRSMSWGNNIPFTSPFYAGLPMIYHFMFVFWVAIWEYFGVSTVLAVNIPSIFSFASLMVMTYFLPQVLAKQKPHVGWLAVLMVITNSSLSFWHMMWQVGISTDLVRKIWQLPTYIYRGPFDGSVISIFVTLNSFVNQRHLAFAIAVSLFAILILHQILLKQRQKKGDIILLGLLIASTFFWNMAICGVALVFLGVLCMVHRRWKTGLLLVASSLVCIGVSLLPYWKYLLDILSFLQVLTAPAPSMRHAVKWNIVQYIWENLGILPLVALFGYVVLPGKRRNFFTVFVGFFALLCVMAGLGKSGFNQKLYNFYIIGIDILAAVGLWNLWEKRRKLFKLSAIFTLIILTISGITSLTPIKNEFAYPLVSKQSAELIRWIRNNTPRDTVVASYRDIIDPVVLAGRKNYYGFFGNLGYDDHNYAEDMKRFYAGDRKFLRVKHISYILIPTDEISNFAYKPDQKKLSTVFPLRYKNEHVLIFDVREDLR